MRPKIKNYSESVTYKYAHAKHDGLWVTLRAGTIHTRHPTDISQAIPGLVKKWTHGIRGGQSFYGELFVPGEPASSVKHYIAQGDEDRLSLSVFAAGHLAPDATLELVDNKAFEAGLPFAPYWPGDTPPQDILRLDIDYEGAVYKDGNLTNWAKWKPLLTVDLLCVDTTEGKGKYLGTTGALVCEDADGNQYTVSGMTDELRDDPPLGMIVEVAYQYIGAQGGLRHPRFIRVRDDKHEPDQLGRY